MVVENSRTNSLIQLSMAVTETCHSPMQKLMAPMYHTHCHRNDLQDFDGLKIETIS